MKYCINRGYYTAARRYDFYLRWWRYDFYLRVVFLTREDKSHIFKPPCNHCNVLFIIYIVPSKKMWNFTLKSKLEKVTWSISSLVKIWKISHCISKYLTLYYIIINNAKWLPVNIHRDEVEVNIHRNHWAWGE
jgi:hypothetical protein